MQYPGIRTHSLAWAKAVNDIESEEENFVQISTSTAEKRRNPAESRAVGPPWKEESSELEEGEVISAGASNHSEAISSRKAPDDLPSFEYRKKVNPVLPKTEFGHAEIKASLKRSGAGNGEIIAASSLESGFPLELQSRKRQKKVANSPVEAMQGNISEAVTAFRQAASSSTQRSLRQTCEQLRNGLDLLLDAKINAGSFEAIHVAGQQALTAIREAFRVVNTVSGRKQEILQGSPFSGLMNYLTGIKSKLFSSKQRNEIDQIRAEFERFRSFESNRRQPMQADGAAGRERALPAVIRLATMPVPVSQPAQRHTISNNKLRNPPPAKTGMAVLTQSGHNTKLEPMGAQSIANHPDLSQILKGCSDPQQAADATAIALAAIAYMNSQNQPPAPNLNAALPTAPIPALAEGVNRLPVASKLSRIPLTEHFRSQLGPLAAGIQPAISPASRQPQPIAEQPKVEKKAATQSGPIPAKTEHTINIQATAADKGCPSQALIKDAPPASTAHVPTAPATSKVSKSISLASSGLKGHSKLDSQEPTNVIRLEQKEEQAREMVGRGKLALVLDLDHTLLNSAKFGEVDPRWEDVLRRAERDQLIAHGSLSPKRDLFRFAQMSMWTKLRPGVRSFLTQVSALFELHIFTMGNKAYAQEMSSLLDPSGALFAGRVIARGDLSGESGAPSEDAGELARCKDLQEVMGLDSCTLIVDDSTKVWPKHTGNLLVAERYLYFPSSRRQFGLAGQSLLESQRDERPDTGMMATMARVLRSIHSKYFQHLRLTAGSQDASQQLPASLPDVRSLLAEEQKSVLAGCRILFTRVFPLDEAAPQSHPLWRTAEQFGASCTTAPDSTVTHVVAGAQGTDKVRWGVTSGKRVVSPSWLEASAVLYRRLPEGDFPVA